MRLSVGIYYFEGSVEENAESEEARESTRRGV